GHELERHEIARPLVVILEKHEVAGENREDRFGYARVTAANRPGIARVPAADVDGGRGGRTTRRNNAIDDIDIGAEGLLRVLAARAQLVLDAILEEIAQHRVVDLDEPAPLGFERGDLG